MNKKFQSLGDSLTIIGTKTQRDSADREIDFYETFSQISTIHLTQF
ncbi:hypothetical protein ES702_06920 [subsurface metagenome]